jgi:hypothetical protein
MKKPILVTGAHRSGSTWVGKIISGASNVRYVHEPFNIHITRQNSPINLWFQHANENYSFVYQAEILSYLLSFCSPYRICYRSKFENQFSTKAVYNYLVELKSRLLNRTLIKDPLALFSAEWIYKTLDSDIIVIIRHPAAFVASLKRKGWTFDFTHFTQQPDLMRSIPISYQNEVLDILENEKEIVDQGILLWNIIYATVLKYKENYQDSWYFVKHEELSQRPFTEFEKIFQFLNLRFDKNVKDQIKKSTQAKTTSEFNRNSIENIKSWKEDLSVDEISQIKLGTMSVWHKYYDKRDW